MSQKLGKVLDSGWSDSCAVSSYIISLVLLALSFSQDYPVPHCHKEDGIGQVPPALPSCVELRKLTVHPD